MNDILAFMTNLPPQGALIALLPLLACALIEDRMALSAFAKFAFQVLSVTIFLCLQPSTSLLLSHVAGLSDLSIYALTAAWMVGTFNALTTAYADDDSLVAVAFIGACSLTLLGYGASGLFNPILVLVPTGFALIFNWQIQSLRLGRALRSILVFFLMAGAATMPLTDRGGWWSTGLLFAYPVLDAAFILFGRIARGAPLFARHPHNLQDCLTQLGVHQGRARLLLVSISAYCGGLGAAYVGARGADRETVAGCSNRIERSVGARDGSLSRAANEICRARVCENLFAIAAHERRAAHQNACKDRYSERCFFFRDSRLLRKSLRSPVRGC